MGKSEKINGEVSVGISVEISVRISGKISEEINVEISEKISVVISVRISGGGGTLNRHELVERSGPLNLATCSAKTPRESAPKPR